MQPKSHSEWRGEQFCWLILQGLVLPVTWQQTKLCHALQVQHSLTYKVILMLHLHNAPIALLHLMSNVTELQQLHKMLGNFWAAVVVHGDIIATG